MWFLANHILFNICYWIYFIPNGVLLSTMLLYKETCWRAHVPQTTPPCLVLNSLLKCIEVNVVLCSAVDVKYAIRWRQLMQCNADSSLIDVFDVKPRYDFRINFPTGDYKLSHGWFQIPGWFQNNRQENVWKTVGDFTKYMIKLLMVVFYTLHKILANT